MKGCENTLMCSGKAAWDVWNVEKREMRLKGLDRAKI